MPAEPTPTRALPAPARGRKLFTLEEANRALPYVRRIVDDISSSFRDAAECRRRIDRPLPGDEEAVLSRQFDACMSRLESLNEELKAVGVELKDYERGLIDFPATFQGREILLCWRRGEERIMAWHEVDAGFAGRRPIDLLKF